MNQCCTNCGVRCDVANCKHNKDCCECTLREIKVTGGCNDCTCCGSFEMK